MSFAFKARAGFTMLEVVVSLLLLTIGALGYAAFTAQLARAFYLNAQRARSGDLVHNQRETLFRQGCVRAVSGYSTQYSLPLRWYVDPVALRHRDVRIVSTRTGSAQLETDSISTTIPCV